MLHAFTGRARTALAAGALIATATLAACSSNDNPTVPSVPASETYATALGVNLAAMTKKSDALYIQDLVVGTGAEAIAGDSVFMRYTGWLVNGQRFDTNIGGSPIGFILGRGEVVAGWDQGIQGMKVGGKRKLVIGSELGYGRQGNGPIGPNQTMVFDVELVNVKRLQ